MKTLLLFLAGTLACGAQTAVYDTSILKEGNTWLYRYQYRPPSSESLRRYSGTRGLTILERFEAGDSLVLRVAHQDSTFSYVSIQGFPDTVISKTADTSRFVLRGNVFSPAEPLFAKGQVFTGAEERVWYRGVIRKRKKLEPWSSCGSDYWENIEGIGSVLDGNFQSCGIAVKSRELSLLSFNGVAFYDSLVVNSLRSLGSRSTLGREATIFLRQGRVLYGRPEKAFDLKGQRVPVGR